jgi:hypothetical protein
MEQSHSSASLRGIVTAIIHRGPLGVHWDDKTQRVLISDWGEDGLSEVISIERGDNMIVNGGLDYIVSLLGGLSTTPAKYLALGSNNAAPAATDTALTSENTIATCTRKLVTPVATGGGSGTLTYTATWSETENVATVSGEVGLLTASSAGTLIAHYAFGTPFPSKDTSTSLTIVYAITAAQAS